MKSKINNTFKEEYKDIKTFIRDTKRVLKAKRKSSIIGYSIFSSLIAISNIAILIISSIALDKVITEYNSSTKLDFVSSVLPTIMVSVVSISLFILSLVITIYQGKMKSNLYKDGMQRIQYQYIMMKGNGDKEEEIKKEIEKIYKDVTTHKKSVSFKKAMINILTGGSNE